MAKILRNVFVMATVPDSPSKRGKKLRKRHKARIGNALDLPSTLPVKDDEDEEVMLNNEADDDDYLPLPSTLPKRTAKKRKSRIVANDYDDHNVLDLPSTMRQ